MTHTASGAWSRAAASLTATGLASLAGSSTLSAPEPVPEPLADAQVAHRLIHAPAVSAEHSVGHGIREVVVRGQTVEQVRADLGDQSGTRFTMSLLPAVDTTTLAGRLKKTRLEAVLQQQDVAGLLGVHVQCMSNWENGRSRPRWLSTEEVELSITSASTGSAGAGRARA